MRIQYMSTRTGGHLGEREAQVALPDPGQVEDGAVRLLAPQHQGGGGLLRPRGGNGFGSIFCVLALYMCTHTHKFTAQITLYLYIYICTQPNTAHRRTYLKGAGEHGGADDGEVDGEEPVDPVLVEELEGHVEAEEDAGADERELERVL